MTAGAVGVRGMWKTTHALCSLRERNKIIYIQLVCHMLATVQCLFLDGAGSFNCLFSSSSENCLVINRHKLFPSPSVLICSPRHKTFISQTPSHSEASAILVLVPLSHGENFSPLPTFNTELSVAFHFYQCLMRIGSGRAIPR